MRFGVRHQGEWQVPVRQPRAHDRGGRSVSNLRGMGTAPGAPSSRKSVIHRWCTAEMHSRRTLSILALVYFAISLSCGEDQGAGRNLSTPAKRLVGHWMGPTGGHSYYGALDGSGQGSKIETSDATNRTIGVARYRVDGEDPASDRVDITVFPPSSAYPPRQEIRYVAKDGLSMVTVTPNLMEGGTPYQGTLTYVDSKTIP